MDRTLKFYFAICLLYLVNQKVLNFKGQHYSFLQTSMFQQFPSPSFVRHLSKVFSSVWLVPYYARRIFLKPQYTGSRKTLAGKINQGVSFGRRTKGICAQRAFYIIFPHQFPIITHLICCPSPSFEQQFRKIRCSRQLLQFCKTVHDTL